MKSVASCFIDPTFRVDLNPTTLTDGHGSRQHFQPCDLPREFTGVYVAWFVRSPPYHFQWWRMVKNLKRFTQFIHPISRVVFLRLTDKVMDFVVLECSGNTSYARIHKTSCSHAKKPNTKTKNTFYHGYFKTYYEARDFAQIITS